MALAVDQTLLVIHGLIFIALFAASRNLLVVVGVHALWNDLASVVESPGVAEQYLTIVGATLALVAVLHVLRRPPARASSPGVA